MGWWSDWLGRSPSHFGRRHWVQCCRTSICQTCALRRGESMDLRVYHCRWLLLDPLLLVVLDRQIPHPCITRQHHHLAINFVFSVKRPVGTPAWWPLSRTSFRNTRTANADPKHREWTHERAKNVLFPLQAVNNEMPNEPTSMIWHGNSIDESIPTLG